MAYETFDSKRARMKMMVPVVSVRASGKLALNAPAAEILKEKGFERALMRWDKDARKMAIAKAGKNDTRSFKVGYSPRGNGQIACKAFVEYIGWSAEHSVKLPLAYEDGMLEATIPAEYLKAKKPKDHS
jgi:hypothetical protein